MSLVTYSTQSAQRPQRSEKKKESGLRRAEPFHFLSGSVTSVTSVVKKLTAFGNGNLQ